MNSLREALKAVKSDIKTIPAAPVKKPVKRYPKPAEVVQLRPKQFVNGYEVSWDAQEGTNRKVPVIRSDEFYIQYPTKGEDIPLPEGTSRVSYNKERKRVEFFKRGSDEPIRYVADGRHEPLPIPRYFSELENVEEIFDLDLETGEITSEMKIDVLAEGVHWKLRLQEFERMQLAQSIEPRVITNRLQKYLKNLEALRGVTVEMLSQPIPGSVLDAIEYAEKKQHAIAVGK